MGRHSKAKLRWRMWAHRTQPRILPLSDYRRRARFRVLALEFTAFLLVFAAGMLVTVWPPTLPSLAPFEALSARSATFQCTVDDVVDGDTFRCLEREDDGRAIRVRLSGVAARERDGSCSPGHPCPIASAEAATAELNRLAGSEVLSCRSVGKTYGRRAAFCATSQGVDLSCAMVASGTVSKWRKYWGLHRCP